MSSFYRPEEWKTYRGRNSALAELRRYYFRIDWNWGRIVLWKYILGYRRTGLYDHPWGRPIYSSGHLLEDMMMMTIIFKVRLSALTYPSLSIVDQVLETSRSNAGCAGVASVSSPATWFVAVAMRPRYICCETLSQNYPRRVRTHLQLGAGIRTASRILLDQIPVQKRVSLKH